LLRSIHLPAGYFNFVIKLLRIFFLSPPFVPRGLFNLAGFGEGEKGIRSGFGPQNFFVPADKIVHHIA